MKQLPRTLEPLSHLSRLYSFIQSRIEYHRGWRRQCWLWVMTALVRLARLLPHADVDVQVRNFRLRIPIDHGLPIYVAVHPHYDTLLPRLVRFISQRRAAPGLIDVGANVGDTVLACEDLDVGRVLAIEANPAFARLLRLNVQHLPTVEVLEEYCTSASGPVEVAITERAGTAAIARADRGTSAQGRSIDDLMQSLGYADEIHILKVDTDGHDFEVLRGARQWIHRCQPAILFECDHFRRPGFVEDLWQLCSFASGSGYSRAIVYDHSGYLFGEFDLRHPETFVGALFYQVTSTFRYFDIVLLEDRLAGAFLEQERIHFLSCCASESERAVAAAVMARSSDTRRPAH